MASGSARPWHSLRSRRAAGNLDDDAWPVKMLEAQCGAMLPKEPVCDDPWVFHEAELMVGDGGTT
jgi:hypothetical protein